MYVVLKDNGTVLGTANTEEQAQALLQNASLGFYTFFVGGSEEAVTAFVDRINFKVDSEGRNFFDILQEKYGKVPDKINLFQEIREICFGNNVFFIKIRYDDIDAGLASEMFKVLENTISAGSTFLILLEKREISECYAGDDIAEDVIAFYIIDDVNEPFRGTNEYIIYGKA